MAWRQTDRTQFPTALLLSGLSDGVTSHIEALQNKSAFFADLHISHGDNWLAVFGTLTPEDDILLPHINAATPLYEALPRCWFPVGTALDMPETIETDFIERMRQRHDLTGSPIVIAPQFSRQSKTQKADVYAIRDQVKLADIIVAEPTS